MKEEKKRKKEKGKKGKGVVLEQLALTQFYPSKIFLHASSKVQTAHRMVKIFNHHCQQVHKLG